MFMSSELNLYRKVIFDKEEGKSEPNQRVTDD
jgi:hypothetical protein